MRGILLLLILGLNPAAWAHPVIFEGGTVLSTMIYEDMSESVVTYSFNRQAAAGFQLDRLLMPMGDTTWALAKLNILAKRWNGEDSQGNIYLMGGAGSLILNGDSEFAGKGTLQADWETRKIYTAVHYSRWFSENLETEMYTARIGVAPFVAGYNDLHIWAMLQGQYNEDMNKNIQVMPLLRFFYKNVMWEVGASTRGNFFAQFMVHL